MIAGIGRSASGAKIPDAPGKNGLACLARAMQERAGIGG